MSELLTEIKPGELKLRDEDDPTIICQIKNIDNKSYWVDADNKNNNEDKTNE